jgi:protein-ribulosamine 3-kinase
LLPDPVRRDVERALQELTGSHHIASATPVGGGCINNGLHVHTDADSSFFLKWNDRAPVEMFAREAEGLGRLRSVDAVVVPEPIAFGGDDASPSWLLMEYVPSGPGSAEADWRLGHGLAKIHAHHDGETFGLAIDNWIGSLPQPNKPSGSWGEFWRDQRIIPQLTAARERGHLVDPLMDRVVDVIPMALSDVTRPRLVHGDLWSGNTYVTRGDQPVLVDPAVYFGDGEVDLAMSELFGGFGRDFYDAYEALIPVSHDYHGYRRELYQLYYLLVHVNLFGPSYLAATRRAAEQVLTALQ